MGIRWTLAAMKSVLAKALSSMLKLRLEKLNRIRIIREKSNVGFAWCVSLRVFVVRRLRNEEGNSRHAFVSCIIARVHSTNAPAAGNEDDG